MNDRLESVPLNKGDYREVLLPPSSPPLEKGGRSEANGLLALTHKFFHSSRAGGEGAAATERRSCEFTYVALFISGIYVTNSNRLVARVNF